MSIVKLLLKGQLRTIEVFIERKKIRNIRLKVFPTGIVKLSIPVGVSRPWIDDYLQKKIPWIEKSLDYFKNTMSNEVETGIHNGVSAWILGRQMTIMVNPSKIYKIEQNEDSIHIQSPVCDDQLALQRQYERWLQKQSKAYFLEVIERLYPIIAQHGFDKPQLYVRKMKTLWGSCSRRQKKINLNSNLYKAPPPCVDYVVLHELAHFLYPHHNKDFYEFLTIHMPDWKERKKILNRRS